MRAAILAIAALACLPGTARAQGEVLAEVRVHGNHTTPDADVLRIAGLSIGQPLSAADIEAARKRLDDSGRFDDVEIRKRYRSLTETSAVALVVLVREHPVPDAAIATTPAPLRPFRRLWASGMFLPIFGYTDGYGLTYGARFTFVDRLGRGSRVSVPLTWGGSKRAAVEAERTLSRGPFDHLAGSVSISRRANPFFDLDEDRREVSATASRALGSAVRAGIDAGYGNVTFGSLDERLGWFGANLTLDTRQDPVFPRNAVFAETTWTALRPSVSGAANRYGVDVRGYRGLVGQSVISVRWQYDGSDRRLPPYERYLLGGASSVRGYRTGAYSGDNMAAASLELRVPLSSPMGIARAGFDVFTDVGTVWDDGTKFSDARWHRGVGAGVFLLASIFQLNLEVGVRQGGGARVHFSTGLQF